MGKGFQIMLKAYGQMKVTDNKGKSATHVWDYANDKARIEGEMTKEEIKASEKAKWEQAKKDQIRLDF